MSWVKEKKESKISKEINSLTLNIESNNIILGEKLLEISTDINLEKENFGLTKSKIEQLINNYLFYKEYELSKDIGYTKLTMLTKIKDKSKIKENIEFAYNSNINELKNNIFNKDNGDIVTKSFVMDSEDSENYEVVKMIAEKISDSKLNNSQIMKFIMIDFIHNNSNIFDD